MTNKHEWNTRKFFLKASLDDVKKALKDGCDPKAVDERNLWTPVDYAAAYSKDPDILDAIIEAGGDPESRDKYKRTAIYHAALNGRAENVLRLGQKFKVAFDHIKDDNGYPPLHVTCESDHTGAGTKALIQLGADKNEIVRGLTPVMAAAEEGIFGVVNVFLESDVDLHHVNSSGQNATDLAAIYGKNISVIQALIDKGLMPNQPHVLFFVDNSEIATLLITEAGIDPNTQYENDGVLHKMIFNWKHMDGEENICDLAHAYLHEGDLDINMCAGYEMRTALMQAIDEGLNEVVYYLLDENADPRIKDAEGVDAMGLARKKLESASEFNISRRKGVVREIEKALDRIKYEEADKKKEDPSVV